MLGGSFSSKALRRSPLRWSNQPAVMLLARTSTVESLKVPRSDWISSSSIGFLGSSQRESSSLSSASRRMVPVALAYAPDGR
ncbi:hypothetical protein D3C85_1513910 [compost metagenome]